MQKWLREVHNIYVLVYEYIPEWPGDIYFMPQLFLGRNCKLGDKIEKKTYTLNTRYETATFSPNSELPNFNSEYPNAYEKALEQGLQEALKLIKNQKL